MKKENKQKNKEKKKKEKPILTEEQIKKRKARNTRIAACCFLLLLGVGVAGNWYWENSDISAKINAVSSDRDKILGEATYVDATTQVAKENAYFSSARVERQTARDESLEKLQKIVDSTKETDKAHIAAADKIASISDIISTENKIETLDVKDFKDVSGYGIIGKIAENDVILGNSKLLDKYDVKNSHKQDEEKLAIEGNSIIYVVLNNEISAIVGVNDIVRENSKEVISKLNKNKIETVMLTGDNTQTAEKIAKEIGITTVISNVTPREKTEVVKKLKAEGKYVMMCGDGINDSPALASSNIGVSVNSGTDIAMDSSDVILTRNDLNSILNLINISKKTIRNIKQNLFWAFFYNSLMIPIAMGLFSKWGITINPMIASFAMVISSLTVTLNALRLRRIKLA